MTVRVLLVEDMKPVHGILAELLAGLDDFPVAHATATDGIRAHCEKLGADAVFLKSEMRELMDYCSDLGGAAAPSR